MSVARMQHAAPFGNARPRPSPVCPPHAPDGACSCLCARCVPAPVDLSSGSRSSFADRAQGANPRERGAAWVRHLRRSGRYLPLLAPQRHLHRQAARHDSRHRVRHRRQRRFAGGQRHVRQLLQSHVGPAEGAHLPRAGRCRVRHRRRARLLRLLRRGRRRSDQGLLQLQPGRLARHRVEQRDRHGGGLGTWSFYTIAPNSLVRAQVYGVLKFTLSPGSYSWKFIPIAGTQFSDSGSAACHNSAPPPPPPPPPPPTPAVNAGPDRSTYPGVAANLSIAFSDTGATDAPWSYQILWGDGSSSTGSTSSSATPINASHAYSALGLDSVRVSVTNSAGRTGSDSLAIRVMAPGTQVALLAGDIADCNNSGRIQTASLLDTLAGTVITVGDNTYPSGSTADYANCYAPTWGRQLYRTYATIGNHDYGLGNANGTWDYFGSAAGPRGTGYYSFDMGSWHVVVLNSNYSFVPTAAGSAQELWLKSDLAGASGKCILAVGHHPPFYSSTTSPLSAGTATLPFWNDLYAAHADVIVNGHMHDYERFAQTNPSGNLDPTNGIREIIAGTGGGGFDAPNTVFWPNSQVRISGVFGVLKLTLSSTAYSWQFVPVAGQTATDSGTPAGHNAGTPPANHPPTAVPGGPYSGSEGAAVAFHGGGSSGPGGGARGLAGKIGGGSGRP